MRTALGVLAAAGVAVVGALVLGEYELRGALPYVAAVLFGLAVAEATITAARSAGLPLAVAGAVFTAIGFVWAAWIESGRDWSYVNANAWLAAMVGAVAAALWIRTFGQRGADSQPRPEQPPVE